MRNDALASICFADNTSKEVISLSTGRNSYVFLLFPIVLVWRIYFFVLDFGMTVKFF